MVKWMDVTVRCIKCGEYIFPKTNRMSEWIVQIRWGNYERCPEPQLWSYQCRLGGLHIPDLRIESYRKLKKSISQGNTLTVISVVFR